MSFGHRLRALRRDRDLTQAQLAERVGCSVTMVRKLEGEQRRPSRELATRLAEVLELPVRDRAEFLRTGRARSRSTAGPLPRPLTRLVGREREIALLRDLLVGKDTRLVTLTG